MEKLQKDALQAAKEITVKFIETGRISPSNFAEVFPSIYTVILSTILTERTNTVLPAIKLEQDMPDA